MTDDDLEERLRTHYRTIDPAQAPTELGIRIGDAFVRAPGRPSPRRPIGARAVGGLAAAIVLTVVGFAILSGQTRPIAIAGPNQSAAVTTAASAAPSAVPFSLRPYRLSLANPNGREFDPPALISTMTDCATMPTDWLRSFCALTLRSDWHAIIAPTAPFAAPPNAYSSVTWLASLARAQIDGDTSICSDVSAREWLTAGPRPVATASGTTVQPLDPMATCLLDWKEVVAKGFFTVTGPDEQHTVQLVVDAGAAARVAAASPPAFDPGIVCSTAPGTGREALTRDVCNRLIAAVTNALGSRQAQVQTLFAYPQPIECRKAGSPCPRPDGGTWLAEVVAINGSNTGLAFRVEEIIGQLVLTEVPFTP